MTGLLKGVPGWAWWVLALALVIIAGGQQVRVSAAQTDAAQAVTKLADYKAEVAERDRRAAVAAMQETKRRIAALDEVQHNAEQQLQVARADAAGAAAALERLQQRLADAEQRSRAAGNSITAQLSQATGTTARVRADLLSRIGEAAGLYAGVADQRAVAGSACERAFDALGGDG
jgi:chromosome segregation ATPase